MDSGTLHGGRLTPASDDLFATQLLLRIPGIGPQRYWQLCDHFGSASASFSAPDDELAQLPEAIYSHLRDLLAKECRHPLWQAVVEDRERAGESGITVLLSSSDDYPALLREISAVPPLLYVKGDASVLHLPQIAMVGSRSPSPVGQDNAFQFARELGASGLVVTSGLALGVDGAAHRGALAAKAKTIAVMGTGIDRVYPHRHKGLAEQILDGGGCLVTEYPFGTGPQASHFPRRNRIISALSMGVLVVEAALKSGSLITARYAMEQGREVFAIPGSIHNPVSRGCHALLKDGATLVECADDMRQALAGMLQWQWKEAMAPEGSAMQTVSVEEALSGDEALVFTSVGFETADLDTLVQRTQLDTGNLLSVLMNLELRGLVANTGSGYQRCGLVENSA
ncbi:DNA-processing protein DprA [Aurantivibrio plasticivorans]